MINILALSGGGIRGVFTTTILERIVKEFPALIDKAALIAGTSTGGIVALGLAEGFAPATLTGLYRDNGQTIFTRRHWGSGVIDSDYDSTALASVLQRYFGERRLYSLNKCVLIPSFKLRDTDGQTVAWAPKFYHNITDDPEGNDGDQFVVDVALETSAAPVYFPSHLGHIDGGMAANNPSMSALCQVLHSWKTPLDQIRLLSIGTGFSPQFIEGDVNWGLTKWAKPLVDIFMAGSEGTVDYEVNELLGTNYERVNKILAQPIGLDDYTKIPDLIAEGNNIDLTGTVAWLNANWK